MRQSANSQTRESGSVLGFIVIALVLIGLLAGGLWFIKNRYNVAAKVDTVSQAAKDEAKKATTTNDKPASNPDSSASTNTSSNNSNNSGATSNGAASTPSASTPSSSSSTRESTTPPAAPATQPATVATTGPSHIASTGPTDSLVNTFLLAGLLVVGYLYRQSRRHTA